MDINLDSLLIQLRSHVTPMWKEFGLVIGIADEVLDTYSSYSPEECLVEVLDYWLRMYHTAENKLTWRDVANAVKEIGLHQLAESILNVCQTGMMIIIIYMHDVKFGNYHAVLMTLSICFIIGQLPVRVDVDTDRPAVSENQVQSHNRNIEQPSPLPPKMAKGMQKD